MKITLTPELDETLKRIQDSKNVAGIILVNKEGITVKSSLDSSVTAQVSDWVSEWVSEIVTTREAIASKNLLVEIWHFLWGKYLNQVISIKIFHFTDILELSLCINLHQTFHTKWTHHDKSPSEHTLKGSCISLYEFFFFGWAQPVLRS